MQPKEKFERDLGEGRKLEVDPSTMQNNSSRVTAVSGSEAGSSMLPEAICARARLPGRVQHPVLAFQGAKGSVSASADARGEPETKRVGGGLPGGCSLKPKLFHHRTLLMLTICCCCCLQGLPSQPLRSLWLLPSPTAATPATMAAKNCQTFRF